MLDAMGRLVALQSLDDRLAALEQENAAIPSRRARSAEVRAACEARVSAAGDALPLKEREQRAAEVALQDREALLKRLEGQQSQVKTNEAYTALLHEMDQARRAISDCEDRILEGLDALEGARAERAAAQAALASEHERLEREESALAAREQELAGEITRLQADRERVCGSLEVQLLELYRKTASRRRPAVVLIGGEICGGCRVNLPPQTYIEILAAERLVTCGNCRRILLPAAKLGAQLRP